MLRFTYLRFLFVMFALSHDQDKEDGPLSKFCQEIADAGEVGQEFMRTIERAHESITLFAPSNAAWDDGNLKNLLRDPQSMKEILYMHLVLDKRLFLENIADSHKRHVRFLFSRLISLAF